MLAALLAVLVSVPAPRDVDRGAQGITGVKGYTDEPLLTAVASPSILFDRYTRGWPLAESFYAASRFVGWEDIVLGDPLCSPYHVENSAPAKPRRSAR
jgi:hypothetical protein